MIIDCTSAYALQRRTRLICFDRFALDCEVFKLHSKLCGISLRLLILPVNNFLSFYFGAHDVVYAN